VSGRSDAKNTPGAEDPLGRLQFGCTPVNNWGHKYLAFGTTL